MRTLALLLALGSAASAGTRVTLRDRSEVSGGYVTLADVAGIEGEALPQIWMGRSPEGDAERAVTAEDVRTELRKNGVEPRLVTIDGAAACRVTRAGAPVAPGLEGFKVVAARAIGEAAQAATPGATVSCTVLEVSSAAEIADFSKVTVVRVKPADGWWLGEARFHLYVNVGDADSAVWTARAVCRGTRKAVIARRAMRAGHRVSASDVAMGEAPAEGSGWLEDPLVAVGRTLSCDVAEGAAVRGTAFAPEPIVRRGDDVAVTSASRNGAAVRRTAVAMEDGRAGDVIRVKNPDSKREFHVRVTGPAAGDAVEE